MARHPLEGIRAKLDRAREDVAALDREFQSLLDEEPSLIWFKPDRELGWHIAYITGMRAAPPELSMLAGEAVFHMRSALEHLVWALVKANKKKPGEHNSFPVALRPYKLGFWETTKTSSLKGVRKSAVAFIEQLQPYHGRDMRQRRSHFICVLNHLARIDRHRTLNQHRVAANPRAIRESLVARPGAEITGFRTLYRSGQRLVDGTKLARLRVVPYSRLHPKVDVKGALPMLIAFGPRPAVPSAKLAEAEELVRWIVDETVRRGFLPA